MLFRLLRKIGPKVFPTVCRLRTCKEADTEVLQLTQDKMDVGPEPRTTDTLKGMERLLEPAQSNERKPAALGMLSRNEEDNHECFDVLSQPKCTSSMLDDVEGGDPSRLDCTSELAGLDDADADDDTQDTHNYCCSCCCGAVSACRRDGSASPAARATPP